MLSLIELYTIEYALYIVGFFISFIVFYGGVFIFLKYKHKPFRNKQWVITITSILGVSLYLINLLFNLSIPASHSLNEYLLHAVLLIFLSAVFSFLIIQTFLSRKMKPQLHVICSTLLTAGILITLISGNIAFFSESIMIRPIYFVLAIIITLAFSLCIVRFLLLLNLNDRKRYYKLWLFVGSLAASIVFSCLPYLLFFGMIDQSLYLNQGDRLGSYLIAVAFNYVCLGLLVYVPDRYVIASQIEQTDRLVHNEQQFKSLFHHNPDAVFSIDAEGKFASVNYVAAEYTGYSIKELKTKSFHEVVAPGEVQLALGMFQRSLQGEVHQFDIKVRSKLNIIKDLHISTVPINVGDDIVGVYGIAKDITEKKRAEKTIHFLAYHDELTGLPNRRYFNEELASLMNQEVPPPFAVMLIDFDRFKRINDLFGHDFGDLVIQSIGKRLEEVLDERLFVSRLGGDEFTIILPQYEKKEDVERVAAAILEAFQSPLMIENQECLLTASIGIALYPIHGSNAAELLKYADMAMYHVKEKDTNNYAFYQEEMSNQTLHKIILENDLRKAIEQDELLVYYQPKVNTETGEVIGFEALVRWLHPEIGLISPNEFIQAAEETGLIIPIEKIVIQHACDQLKIWQQNYGEHYTMSVNISQRHFYQENIVCTIIKNLERSGIAPETLEIEITESMAMFNEHTTIQKLQKIRELGVAISMDDFGTGYSSLHYLTKLPINRVKIDQTFIRGLLSSSSSLGIVTTIISLARHLHLDIIAEGVETEEQIEMLKQLECYDVQGFYFSKPLPVEGVEAFLNSKEIEVSL
ncbi:EAL domain-containing protein [Guptibacillus algicola]|uniref:EAL domain-containing protein n=1 Tax=Guptibacillus algicola TaxID=225844 RepID=UPI001CD1B41D|nr:EAL domain-containing protein [Alkalihalobacillus algicola]MCA0989038.1 EAL domain-containing protein [Alkalihalobacillus algicola]